MKKPIVTLFYNNSPETQKLESYLREANLEYTATPLKDFSIGQPEIWIEIPNEIKRSYNAFFIGNTVILENLKRDIKLIEKYNAKDNTQ